MHHITLAKSDADIDRCFPVMLELRPHLIPSEFIQRVRQQAQNGYQLVSLDDCELVRAVAGFRLSECLASGRFLYVDDLVTRSRDRLVMAKHFSSG